MKACKEIMTYCQVATEASTHSTMKYSGRVTKIGAFKVRFVFPLFGIRIVCVWSSSPFTECARPAA